MFGKKAIDDRSQGSAMAVTSASEGGVFRAASGGVLNGDARRVVHGIGEPIMAGLSSHHDAALARPLCNRRDPGQTAQGGVVSSLQGIKGFCWPQSIRLTRRPSPRSSKTCAWLVRRNPAVL
jgi:hypothetical protein